MINPSEFDISTLPSLPLELKRKLPKQAAIYLAVSQEGKVLYVGQSVNPRSRWTRHHCYKQLKQMEGVRVCYLIVDSPEKLNQIESALIKWFDPPLNVKGKSKTSGDRVPAYRKRPASAKRQPTQHKGGRLPDGSPNRSNSPKKIWAVSLSPEVIDAIANLPQVQSGEWSKSYLAEQLWRNYLGLPADYDWADLQIVANKRVVE